LGTEAPPGEFVAVDWGSSRLRLRLLSGEPLPGGILGERTTDEGIGAVEAGRHEAVFLANLERLLGAAGRWEDFAATGGDVYFAGMITSTLGWVPTPYVTVPAGPSEVLAGRRVERIGRLRLHFLPGIRSADDILRGEEVETFGICSALGLGLDQAGATLLVLPGTHSKWIQVSAGRIQDFSTVLTGDLHAGLHRSTLLARTLPPEPAAVEGDLLGAFDRGVDLAKRDGGLTSLFKARSLPVLEGMAPRAASALLSGILIGGEILERIRGRSPLPTLVGGAARLGDLYLRAFKGLRTAAERVPERLSEYASAEGLRFLRAPDRA